MPTLFSQIDAHIDANIDKYLEWLTRLVAQPSISAQNDGITECAHLVAAMLEEQDFSSQVLPSDGHPVVYGVGGEGDKTMLFYLHYDVQPADPVELWNSPPFEITRVGDQFFGRGISDDKGHIVARMAAVDALRSVLGALPCKIKWMVEGEEEIGSPNMPAFVEKHQKRFAADACIWEFGSVDYAGNPTLTLGMRGICFVELSVSTASRDAHSGLGGSIFPNAAWRLTWALNSLKDSDERILIPGFYENVIPPTERDLEYLGRLPDDSRDLIEAYGLDGFLQGMTDWAEIATQAVFAPTCTICGLTSGYQGAGTKTVLPATARAKVDFRLVPNQTPEEIVAKLRSHLDQRGFADVAVDYLGGGRPAKVDPDHPFVQMTIETARQLYGREPVVEPMIGGSGPLYPIVHLLDVPVVSAGIGYPGSNVHAPNENMLLKNFRNGIRHTAHIIAEFAKQ